MEYEDFELQIGPLSREGLLVRVRSPAGEGEALAHLPRGARDPELLTGMARHLTCGEAYGLPSMPADVGRDLFQSVFVGSVSDLFQQSLSRVEASARGLRLRVRINPRDPTLASLLDLPWELLYRKDTEDFLALSRGTPIVRALDVPRPVALRRYQPPLRVLAVLARDPESSPLSLEEELKQLRGSLERNPEIRLEALEDPDTRTIRNALDQEAFHILHYMGHGAFEPASGEGALLFGGPGGRLPVTGRHLAAKVRDLDALQLVVLNACETAVVGGESVRGPFAGVASALVLGGIPAVVAMQSSIRDAHSLAFTSAFYQRLAGGMPVEEAVTEGRQAIHSLEPDAASWAIPVLFLRAGGDLFSAANRKELQATASLPAEPSRQVRGMRRLPVLAIALVLSGVAAIGIVDRGSRQMPGQPISSAITGLSGALVEPHSTELEEKDGPARSRESVRQAVPTPAPPPRSSSASTALGERALRFVITGNAPLGLSAVLRREAQPLSSAFSGRTVHLNVETALQSFNEGEMPMSSCRLMVNASVQDGNKSVYLDPISVAGAQTDDHSACEEAARKLARSVVQSLDRYLQEGYR